MSHSTISSSEVTCAPSSCAIPDYQLLQKIGAGGCGEVYVARNRHDGDFYAVKVVFPHRSNVELDAIRHYKNVVRDSQFLVQIQHVGRADTGEYYYVMPLADDANGPAVLRAPDQYKPLTLQRHRAARGPLGLDEALGIADCLLLALNELHTSRLVHCDVKPANVLRMGGKWRLGDIGLMSPRELLTGSRGTRWFFPAEDQADFGTDVYALGKTLLLLVTDSKQPDSESTSDPLDDFIGGTLEIPGKDDRKARVRQIILGACHKDPRKRTTARTMHETVSSLLQRTTVVLNIVGMDYDSLDEAQLVRELASRLGLCILSMRKRHGSVLVEVEVTPAQAEYLLEVAKAGKLADLHVSGAWRLEPDVRGGGIASEGVDVELVSTPIRRKQREILLLLAVAAFVAGIICTTWFAVESVERKRLASIQGELHKEIPKVSADKGTRGKPVPDGPVPVFTVEGKIGSVLVPVEDKTEVVVKTRLGGASEIESSLLLVLKPNYPIRINGKRASAGNLRPGMRIKLHFSRDGETLLDIESDTER
jgi:hypothetical protein